MAHGWLVCGEPGFQSASSSCYTGNRGHYTHVYVKGNYEAGFPSGRQFSLFFKRAIFILLNFHLLQRKKR